MMSLASDVIACLSGKTLATAESCTGGGIGNALTEVPGASDVFKGGVISYCNAVKESLLGVPRKAFEDKGAVSAAVAEEMAKGARRAIGADVAVSVTGLAGPSGDAFGNPVGTVYIGYADEKICLSRHFLFAGDRQQIRRQAVQAALQLILEYNDKKNPL